MFPQPFRTALLYPTAPKTMKSVRRGLAGIPVRMYPATILITALILSLIAPLRSGACRGCGEERTFFITAYYSPLPDQERYIMGSYEEEIAFNGHGLRGSDGTEVYPGMIAAPPEIPFGTRIELPSLGVVGTVHDRGGWIQMNDDGSIHIDLWLGHGEEGLARALAWGGQKVKGKISMPGDRQPGESFSLALFPAPESAIGHIGKNPINLLSASDLVYDSTSQEIAALQFALRKIGYLDHEITSYYGDETKNAVHHFQRDLRLAVHGEKADSKTRTALVAQKMLADALTRPLIGYDILTKGDNGTAVRTLQRTLALLSFYDGEPNGTFDQKLVDAVYAFQRSRNIVYAPSDTGAGMMGPHTRRALLTAWRDYRVDKRGGDAVVAAGQFVRKVAMR